MVENISFDDIFIMAPFPNLKEFDFSLYSDNDPTKLGSFIKVNFFFCVFYIRNLQKHPYCSRFVFTVKNYFTIYPDIDSLFNNAIEQLIENWDPTLPIPDIELE